MIARMLSDFGANLNWVERPEQGISTMRAGWSGLFYVPDAAATKDQNQRFIIPAQDFVREQNIRTVFGVGGAYSAGTLFAVILFCRRDLSRESAKRFMPLSSLFRTLTAGCVESGRIFASPS
jgi:hypothetical protein